METTQLEKAVEDVEFFLKFGKKEHIERLHLRGEIFMKPMHYYRTCDNKEIKDPLEGISEVVSFDQLEVYELNEERNGPGRQIGKWTGKFIEYPTEKINGNIYCLYSLRKEDFRLLEKKGLDSITVDPQFNNYDYVAFINADEFIRRFEKACQKSGVNVQHGLVKYLDLYNYTGPLSPFNKDNRHSHQKEYRFFFPNSVNEDISYSIGSLDDICKIGSRISNQQIRFSRKR